MIYKIDHDYHIHTYLSSCSNDPRQSIDRIQKYALDNKLSTVAITDHFWDSDVSGASSWYRPQNLEHISKNKPLPTTRVTKFLFGCETEMRSDGVIGIHKDHYSEFDFIIVPTTHLHMTGFTITDEDAESDDRRAELWVSRFERLLDSDLPFKRVGIPHLNCSLIRQGPREKFLDVIRKIPTDKMGELFTRAAKLGVGIEINKSAFSFTDSEADTMLRPFRIARSAGCKFYLGSDAHKPEHLDGATEVFERAIRLLDLRESDKFHIGE